MGCRIHRVGLMPKRGYAISKYTTDDAERTVPELSQPLDDLAREGARRMIAEALRLEAEEYVGRLRHLRDDQRRALVVRNGKAQERTSQLVWGRRLPVCRPAQSAIC